jgi:hypothetical protein
MLCTMPKAFSAGYRHVNAMKAVNNASTYVPTMGTTAEEVPESESRRQTSKRSKKFEEPVSHTSC